ncbi:hypothetical protein NDU88_005751 [Pleurodeles waltl]|uniref:Uncharacterized protein n=1 Tax=Pleurodeles waltl TaxID=8319 RepID=A0AAV7VP38_PLEWA|nr:hypothetical protein NDU88_005751 [Pleurodeles waltl]
MPSSVHTKPLGRSSTLLHPPEGVIHAHAPGSGRQLMFSSKLVQLDEPDHRGPRTSPAYKATQPLPFGASSPLPATPLPAQSGQASPQMALLPQRCASSAARRQMAPGARTPHCHRLRSSPVSHCSLIRGHHRLHTPRSAARRSQTPRIHQGRPAERLPNQASPRHSYATAPRGTSRSNPRAPLSLTPRLKTMRKKE